MHAMIDDLLEENDLYIFQIEYINHISSISIKQNPTHAFNIFKIPIKMIHPDSNIGHQYVFFIQSPFLADDQL